ncbi:MAG: hypothetical protein G01um101419_288 [Parcubacteria group bacterium Gr01-1014_19]|nr:MAG: hypothetical protein G01um101419_288 [Parcubacteria group bacterium Gr01-1014_19]
MGTGKRLWKLVAVLVIVCSLSGCMGSAGGLGWSLTPYGGIGGNTDRSYQKGLSWQAGVSVTFFNQFPGAPAVPQFPGYYRNDVHVDNTNNNSNTQSQTQNQSQSQSQSQEQGQSQTTLPPPSGGDGDDDEDCEGKDHGHGHDHHDDDHPGHGHGHDCDDDD